MNIYAESGHKVRYTGENGYQHDHDNLKKLGVKVGDILTLDYADIDTWNTAVCFEEIRGWHNSVVFEDVL